MGDHQKMGSLLITKLMLAMVIFLRTNSNVLGDERNVCEYCTHNPGFPSKRDSLKTGVYIGICRDDHAPHNENCGGSFEYIKQCEINAKGVCNKDEPMAVVHTGVKVGIPVALILVGLIALFVCWKKNLLCFKKSRSENLQ